jgi:hypothetical protein
LSVRKKNVTRIEHVEDFGVLIGSRQELVFENSSLCQLFKVL